MKSLSIPYFITAWLILVAGVGEMGCSTVVAPPEGAVKSLRGFAYKAASPVEDSLFPVYPNPFNRATGDTSLFLEFNLDSNSRNVHLLIQNMLGDEVAGYSDTLLLPGFYAGGWTPLASDGTRLNAGLYFITLRTDNFIYSRLVNIEENE